MPLCSTPTALLLLFLHLPHLIASQSTPQFRLPTLTRQNVCPLVLPTTTPSSRTTRQSFITSRIIGGREIDPLLAPFVVYLTDNRRQCTGSLIHPQWVLTAAHCAVSIGHRAFINSTRSTNGFFIDIVASRIHPLYDRTAGANYDVALARLATRVPSSQTMPINANLSVPMDKSAARVMGFGTTSKGKTGTLLMVDVPIVPIDVCNSRYGGRQLLKDVDLCAGYPGCDSCFGDSGGPLVQYNARKQPVVIGVVSRGVDCGEANHPGVYARISYFHSWIRSIIPDVTFDNSSVQLFTDKFPDRVYSQNSWTVNWWVFAGGGTLVAIVVLNVAWMVYRTYSRKPAIDENDDENVDPADRFYAPPLYEVPITAPPPVATDAPNAPPPPPPEPPYDVEWLSQQQMMQAGLTPDHYQQQALDVPAGDANDALTNQQHPPPPPPPPPPNFALIPPQQQQQQS